jgi:antitoxin MazE
MRIDAHESALIHTHEAIGVRWISTWLKTMDGGRVSLDVAGADPMLIQVARWGNSLVLRLPRAMARQIGVDAGGRAEILAEGDPLIVWPAPAPARWTLDDLLANMTPEAMGEAFDWGEDSGREQIDD